MISIGQSFIRTVQERIRSRLSLVQRALHDLRREREAATHEAAHEAATAAVLDMGLSVAAELESTRAFQNLQIGTESIVDNLYKVFHHDANRSERVASVREVVKAVGQIKTGMKQA